MLHRLYGVELGSRTTQILRTGGKIVSDFVSSFVTAVTSSFTIQQIQILPSKEVLETGAQLIRVQLLLDRHNHESETTLGADTSTG